MENVYYGSLEGQYKAFDGERGTIFDPWNNVSRFGLGIQARLATVHFGKQLR